MTGLFLIMDPAKAHKDRYGETPMERFERLRREQDSADADIDVNLHLTGAAGSDPLVIAQIAEVLGNGQPFGLKNEQSTIVFIPHQMRSYTFRHGGGLQGRFDAENEKQFLNHVKMSYLFHKQLISTDELLGLAKILKYEQQQKHMEILRNGVLPQSGDSSGPMDPSDPRAR